MPHTPSEGPGRAREPFCPPPTTKMRSMDPPPIFDRACLLNLHAIASTATGAAIGELEPDQALDSIDAKVAEIRRYLELHRRRN